MNPTGPFDERLAKVLAGSTAAGVCPDPEVLAAFADGELAGDALAACQAHVASCSRCQAVVATVVLDDDIGSEAHPPHVAATASPTTQGQAPSRRWTRAAQVAVPLGLAASLVAAVWIAREPRPPASDTRVVSDGSTVPPAVADLPVGNTSSSAVSSGPLSQPPAGPAESRAAAPRLSAPAAAKPEAPSAAAMRAAGPVAAAPGSPAETAEFLERPMRQQTTAKSAVTSAREADASGLDRPLAAFVVESPSRRVGWRVAGGTITRHVADGPPTGQTTTGDDLRAGMAWSDVEAWVVGARGAVWRTANGDTWTRVPFPGAQTLVRVDVSGPGTATVTTETGDRLTTTDAGRTWTPAIG